MPIFESMTRAVRVLLPASATVLAAGCSADVARFDFPSSGFASSNQTNSVPIPPASVYGAQPRAGLLGEGDGASHQPPAMSDNGGGSVRMAELPPASSGNGYDSSGRPSYRDTPPARSYDRAGDRGYDQVATKPYDAAPRNTAARGRRDEGANFETSSYHKPSGETVEVKSGDTLYSLSRQHGVLVNDIMAANDLKGHSLKPGQRLTMPAGRSSGKAVAATTSGAPTPPAEAAAPSTPASAPVAESTPAVTEASGETAGTYTMKAGDSLYTIARQHKVKYADLQQANGITDADVRKIRPGTVLKIPANSVEPKTRASTTLSLSQTGTHLPVPSEAPAASPPPSAPAGDGPKVLNASEPPASAPASAETAPPAAPSEQKVAALDTKTSTDAVPVTESRPADTKSSTAGRLRWPVQGRIISQFGPRPDGTHNDGVNFSVPLGTDVHAAESGEVIYVGDELKAYGKLVLLRHENGWVTAYAHNEELLVTRGKKVGRGDVIAKAGKTGPVDQPQVHFELRQDSKAVDPTSFMEKH